MKAILRIPAVNSVCITLFTAFYSLIFITTAKNIGFKNALYYNQSPVIYPFWSGWSRFLAAGYHVYIAYALIAATVLVAVMLLVRRRTYDEYHTANLLTCLAVATILTLIAIAIQYLLILNEPNGVIEKFTLFIVIHWVTVVLADLIFVFLNRWK